MNLSAIVRRHRVGSVLATLFVLVITVVGGLIGASRTVPAYQSDGIVLIIPPGAGSDVATNNPFVNLDSNVSQLAQALSTRMTAPDIVAGLTARAPSITGYTAVVRYDNAVVNSVPTSQLQFTVTGTDAQVARDAVQQVMVMAGDNLKQLQLHAGVTEKTLADSVQLVAPTEPVTMPVSAARAAGIWAVSALLISLMVVAAAIGLARLFGGRRTGGDATGSGKSGSDETGSESDSDRSGNAPVPGDDLVQAPAEPAWSGER